MTQTKASNKTKKFMTVLTWIIVFECISYGLGQLSDSNITPWYAGINKSPLTPPGFVFGIVWPILYAMIAITGWSLWTHRKHPKTKPALVFYSIQMLSNWAWSPLFFHFHLITASFVCIICTTVFTLMTILATKNHNKLCSLMLTPYFLWLLFASYLNCVTWVLN
ncbi:MAG: tryptophan-rich sensory protein [Legionella sp.]|nr:tryptophan-rich sensory protein [Legionella sp.]